MVDGKEGEVTGGSGLTSSVTLSLLEQREKITWSIHTKMIKLVELYFCCSSLPCSSCLAGTRTFGISSMTVSFSSIDVLKRVVPLLSPSILNKIYTRII